MKPSSIVIVMISILLLNVGCSRKLKNYGVSEKYRSTTDFLGLRIQETETEKVAPALIASAVGAGIGIYNTIIERRKKSYAAVYSNTVYLENIVDAPLTLVRYMITDKSGTSNTYEYKEAATFQFAVKGNDNIEISLQNVRFAYSKARSKKSEKYERIAISIHMKLTGFDKDGAAKELGESNIVIPIIRVSNATVDFRNNKFISPAKFAKLDKVDKKTALLSVTINEVNLSHVDPNTIEQILKNNGSDLLGVLKAVIKAP